MVFDCGYKPADDEIRFSASVQSYMKRGNNRGVDPNFTPTLDERMTTLSKLAAIYFPAKPRATVVFVGNVLTLTWKVSKLRQHDL